MTNIESNGIISIRCDHRSCDEEQRFDGNRLTWEDIDISLIRFEWVSTKKNGTWHHACKSHKDFLDKSKI